MRTLIGWLLVTWYRLKSNVARAGNNTKLILSQSITTDGRGYIVTKGSLHGRRRKGREGSSASMKREESQREARSWEGVR